MNEMTTIQGEKRGRQNKHGNERLRRSGLIPAVIYGHGQPPESVALSLHDLEAALSQQQHVVRVRVDGREDQFLLKDVQYDHLQSTPIHADLMRVDVTERVKVKVAVELRGTPKGAAEGGHLVHVLTEVEIECPLLEIPDALRARVDHLAINDILHVRDFDVPAHVRVLQGADDIVAVVHPPRAVAATTAEAAPAVPEGGAEPEVISKGKVETEESSE